jgi:hypothetical protein
MAKVKKSTTVAEKKATKKVASPAKKSPPKAVAAKPVAKAKPAKAADAPGNVAIVHAVEPAVEKVPLSDEEMALTEVYGDDLAPAGAAHAEFRDRRTADEDRPMMPEISARHERKKMWDDRRDGRHSRRDQREKERQARREARGNGAAPATSSRPPQEPERSAAPANQRPLGPGAQRPPIQTTPAVAPVMTAKIEAKIVAADGTAPTRIGNSAGDAAASLFATLPHAQPIPVKQLAQMLRKRGMFEADPETYWPTLKAELLHDERSYRSVGLRPRVAYRGRDLFGPGPALTSASAMVERSLATAINQLQDHTAAALSARLKTASASGFERLITAYLVATGYRDIGWVKRVDGISYASATAPGPTWSSPANAGERGIGKQVLVSARSGSEPVDRRGIGELRVGVEAKGLSIGVLFAAAPLSAEAERELERGGRSITVVCADNLLRALLDAGVGVHVAPAQLRYIDDSSLDELLTD